MATEGREARLFRISSFLREHRAHTAIAAIIIIIIGIVAVAWRSERRHSISAGVGSGPQVMVVPAVARIAIITADKYAIVIPTPDSIVQPLSPAWVTAVRVRPGMRVKSGDVVLLVRQANSNDNSIEAAKQNLQIAQARLLAARGDDEAAQSAVTLAEQRLLQSQNALTAAQANQEQAETTARSAASAVQQLTVSIKDRQDMFRRGVISRQELRKEEEALLQAKNQVDKSNQSAESARSDVESAESDIAKQKNALEQANKRLTTCQCVISSAAAEVSKQERALRDSIATTSGAKLDARPLALRSPVDGIVTQVTVEKGSLVAPGSDSVVIRPANVATLAFGANEAEAAQLMAGMLVLVKIPNSKQVLSGSIALIPNTVDGGEHSRRVIISMNDTRGLLKPGAKQLVKIIRKKTPGASVPSSAVVRSLAGTSVWIVRNGKARQSNVTVLSSDGKSSVVRGIRPKAMVVVNPSKFLKNGALVAVQR